MKNTFLLFVFVLINVFSLNAQKVYLCSSDKDADIIVYKCYSEKKATGNNGRWVFVKNDKDADV